MTVSAVPASVVADLVTAARGYLRVPDGAEADVFARAAAAAIVIAEAFCGTVLIGRGHEDVVAATVGWQRLRAGPVTAIAGVTALLPDAAPAVLPVGAYAVDIDANGEGWVRVIAPAGTSGAAATVAVSYTAGLATSWATVPAALAQGLVLLVAHIAEHRDGDVLPPAAVAALWRPFRTLRLAESRR